MSERRYPSELPLVSLGAPVRTVSMTTGNAANQIFDINLPLLAVAKVYHIKCAPKGARRIDVAVRLSCAKCGGTIARRRIR